MTTTLKHFFSPLIKFFDTVSHIGTASIDDERLRRKVILSNQLSLTAAIVVVSIGIRLCIEIGPMPLPGYTFITAAYCLVLWFNKKGMHNVSRLYLNILPTINLLVVSSITSDDVNIANKFAFMSIVVVPLVFFDLHEKKMLTFGILWVIAMFYLTDIVNPYIPRLYKIDPASLDNLTTINRNAFMSFVLFVIACIYLQRLNLRAEKKIYALYQETNVQKEALEERNKTITESINYARYIQKAVLSRPEVLDNHCSDHFLLFQPKDIVSGDFWVFKSLDNRLIVSVADGTGHGVPGAFLSMLGVSFLTEVVRKSQDLSPAQALFDLRSQIKNALHQQDFSAEMHDGMDMSLVIINTQTGMAEFAGARRPIYLIRASNPSEIEEFKPDRMPIGIYESETNFTNNEFKLEKGDTLYLFTDGFEDQLGGLNHTKFKSKAFKETLIAMQKMPMEEQKNHLLDLHRKWKGEEEQTDDVLIVGIRI